MKSLGMFFIGFYIAICGIALLTDPWTQLEYDRSVRELGRANNNAFTIPSLIVRPIYGIWFIFSGYCIMNRITAMKLIISGAFLLDILLRTAFHDVHSIFQDAIVIGIVNYI